jgi:hypothetical protein
VLRRARPTGCFVNGTHRSVSVYSRKGVSAQHRAAAASLSKQACDIHDDAGYGMCPMYGGSCSRRPQKDSRFPADDTSAVYEGVSMTIQAMACVPCMAGLVVGVHKKIADSLPMTHPLCMRVSVFRAHCERDAVTTYLPGGVSSGSGLAHASLECAFYEVFRNGHRRCRCWRWGVSHVHNIPMALEMKII